VDCSAEPERGIVSKKEKKRSKATKEIGEQKGERKGLAYPHSSFNM
jgi:hypothetical protein